MVIFQPVIVILVAQEVFDDGFEHQDYVRSRHHEMKLHSKNISLTGEIYMFIIHILCIQLSTSKGWYVIFGYIWCQVYFPDLDTHRKLCQVNWSLEDEVQSWRRPVTATILLVGFTNQIYGLSIQFNYLFLSLERHQSVPHMGAH